MAKKLWGRNFGEGTLEEGTSGRNFGGRNFEGRNLGEGMSSFWKILGHSRSFRAPYAYPVLPGSFWGILAILGHSGPLHAYSEPLWLILGILGHSEPFSTPHANSVLPMLILGIPGSFWGILGYCRQTRALHAYSGPPCLILGYFLAILSHSGLFSTPYAHFGPFWQLRAPHAHSGPPWLILGVL